MLKLTVWGQKHSEEGEITHITASYIKADTDSRVIHVRLHHFRRGKQLSNRKKGPFRKGSYPLLGSLLTGNFS